MVQDSNYKVKSLSPAVSAFQFHVKTPSATSSLGQGDGLLKISTTSNTATTSSSNSNSSNSEDYFNSSKSYQSSPSTPTISGKEGYVYKDQLIILDEETRLKLTHMGQLPLDAEWTFWYDKFVPNLPASDYESNLKVISTAKTVQKFWSIYNNIDGPDRLGFRSNYHFMKTGIKPIWEDPQNEYGGSYNFKINKQQSSLAWRDILVLLIGEKVEDWIKNTVFGVSVSSRQHVDNYQIWTAHHNKNIQDSIVRAKLEELLYPADIQSFYFKMHKTHADFQKPTTPTSAHSPKTDMAASLSRPIEMRRKITEESIERVVQDIEKLKLRERVK
ncbi:translation initiation factor eIF 4e-like domain-containing protein [Mucor mucedo]|uniref:translation initiation factor eIF 4e-like domain-containing protein n=1 Tax=Mucor mucedo TaxID=29922 RepID=UPI00221E5752|nr:translation initiation factor eIF 4e-like domain-containing protein [Mucor mucedo]KAI7888593.1 translation initiation factor eIF 4e-like domain-containing protein [Mucor mucedo]